LTYTQMLKIFGLFFKCHHFQNTQKAQPGYAGWAFPNSCPKFHSIPVFPKDFKILALILTVKLGTTVV